MQRLRVCVPADGEQEKNESGGGHDVADDVQRLYEGERPGRIFGEEQGPAELYGRGMPSRVLYTYLPGAIWATVYGRSPGTAGLLPLA